MIDREIAETVGEERIDALLREAASFVPEHAAPDDLCSRALCKTAVAAPFRPRRYALLAGGGVAAALAAFSVACVMNIVSGPRTAPNQVASTHQNVIAPRVDAVPPIGRDQAAPETVVAHTAVASREPARLRRVRHRRFAAYRELASIRTDRVVVPPPSPRQEERPQVATVTAQPAAAAKSCWTTEDVQETKYVLVSPGIVTDGSGDSERATPVLVQLPISSDNEASYGDEAAAPTETTTH